MKVLTIKQSRALLMIIIVVLMGVAFLINSRELTIIVAAVAMVLPFVYAKLFKKEGLLKRPGYWYLIAVAIIATIFILIGIVFKP